MESKTYVYEPVEEIIISEERKEELIEKIKIFIKKDSVPVFSIVNIAQSDIECQFIFEWLQKNKITIRGINSTLEKEIENYEYINRIGAPGDKTKGYKPSTISKEEQSELFYKLNELKNGLSDPNKNSEYIKIRNYLTETSIRLVKWLIGTSKNVNSVELEYDDKVQIGTIGLMNAVEHFDVQRGFAFSTYAVIAVMREIYRAEGKNKEIPDHIMNELKSLKAVIERFEERGINPTQRQLAEVTNMKEFKVEALLGILEGDMKSWDELYLEEVTGKEIDNLSDGTDVVQIADEYYVDGHIVDPDQKDISDYEESENVFETASASELRQKIEILLDTLTYREAQILRLRFGLEDGRNRSLEEVGQYFNITRERIRQIEAKALRKMRHPRRSRNLREFIH